MTHCLFPGVPKLITADMVKQGACVIDVGINRIKDEKTNKFKMVGDVDFDGKLNAEATILSPLKTVLGATTHLSFTMCLNRHRYSSEKHPVFKSSLGYQSLMQKQVLCGKHTSHQGYSLYWL